MTKLTNEQIEKVVHGLRINCKHEEANLIEQQQREIEALAAHVERINRVLDDKGKTIEFEYCPDQFQIDNEALESVLSEAPQTSLAEVKSKQAEESYLCGYCDGLRLEADIVKIDSGIDAEKLAKQHAAKIREGGE